ncbi:MAG: phosphatidate cytidylyltransferase [Bacteroidetes bacterium]|nr:phosphatidate cytidylyltransferase [Bacteroidota bacterium]
MRTLITRSASGALFVVLIIGSITWNFYSFALLFYLILLLAHFEFFRLLEENDIEPLKIPGYFLSTLFYSLAVFLPDMKLTNHFFLLLLILLVISSILISGLYRKEKYPFREIFGTLFPVFYITVPFMLFILSANTCDYIPSMNRFNCTYDSFAPIGFFIILWTNDSIAYLAGSYFGRHKLFPSVSPNKSWEGVIAGFTSGMIAAYCVSYYYEGLTLWSWIGVSVIIGIFAPLGDLIESKIKRSARSKNSGNIMPGHGGVLDRFDGFLLAAPVYWGYLTILKNL